MLDNVIKFGDLIKRFGLKTVAVLCVIVGLVILIANKWLGIPWPEYVIVGSICEGFGLLLFILLVIKDIVMLRKGVDKNGNK